MELKDLRVKLKKHGITVIMKTYSHGPQASISIDGVCLTSCIPSDKYEGIRERIRIMEQVIGNHEITHNGAKVYGFKSLRKSMGHPK